MYKYKLKLTFIILFKKMCFEFGFKTINVLRLFNVCGKLVPPPWNYTAEGSAS